MINLSGGGIQSGVSMIVCCMNRQKHLEKCILSCDQIEDIHEIIIVDWSSSNPIERLLAWSDKVKIFRIEGEKKWILTYAYNFAIQVSSYSTILKFDCDYIVKNINFLKRYIPLNGKFYTGKIDTSLSRNQLQFCGMLLCERSILIELNGYNENITSYGYDDIDLYKRIQSSGYKQHILSIEDFDFLVHGDDERALEAGFSASKLIKFNQYMSHNVYPHWNSSLESKQYECIGENIYKRIN